MLIITFLNDGTGDEIEGNYQWKVLMNRQVLAEGVIKSHNRISGWVGLVKYFAKALEGEVKKRDFTIVRRDGTR